MRWNRVAVSFAVCVVAGCASLPRPGYHPLTEVIAHRGASAYAPENTLRAFALAAEMGADWFELDCMLTADGHVIVVHDGDLERVAGTKVSIAGSTLEALLRYDAGSWKGAGFAGERLPTLRQALSLAKERGIGVYLEIKNIDDDGELMAAILHACGSSTTLTAELRRTVSALLEESRSRNVALTRATLAIIREMGMDERVVIQSFAPVICAVAKLEAPEIRVELLGSDDPEKPERWEQLLRWLYLLDLDGFNIHHESVTLGRLAMVHAADKRMAVWTVNDPEVMRRLAHWGVDAIITDHPDVCLEVLKEAGRRRSP